MSKKSKGIFFWVMILSLGVVWTAWGEEPEPTPPVSKKAKGRVPREKEAEGTQAPNRFESDNIIKSKYELNGQALEVDTD